MGNSICAGHRTVAQNAASTGYRVLGDAMSNEGSASGMTEANAQVYVTTAGTLGLPFAGLATANSLNAGNGVVTSRPGGSNGNCSFTVTTAAPTEYLDSSDSDLIAANTLYSTQHTNGGSSGSLTVAGLTHGWNCAGSLKRLTNMGYVYSAAASASPGWFPPSGGNSALTGGANNAAETQAQVKFRLAATLQNFQQWSNLFGANGTVVFHTRIGGGDGTLSVTVSAVAVRYTDGSDTDQISATQTLNYRSTLGTATSGNNNGEATGCEAVTTGGSYYVINFYCNNPGSLAAGNTYYQPLGGRPGTNQTENIAQVTVRQAFTAGNFGCNCNVFNPTGGTTSCFLRKNGSTTALGSNVTSATVFEDTSDSVNLAATDQANYIDSIGTGGTVLLAGRWLVAAPPQGWPYQDDELSGGMCGMGMGSM